MKIYLFMYDHDMTMRSKPEPEAVFTSYKAAYDYGKKKYNINEEGPLYSRPWEIKEMKVEDADT